jgi:replicative DNA helicase
LATLHSKLREIAQETDGDAVVESAHQFFVRRYGDIDKYLAPREAGVHIPTPWKAYNDCTRGGIKRKELTVIAARPSSGKTAWAINVAAHAAIKHYQKVLFFSAEQPKEDLFDRAVCYLSKVTIDDMRAAQKRFVQDTYVRDAISDILESHLFIDDSGKLTVDQIDARAEIRFTAGGLDLMITDFLNTLDIGKLGAKNDNRTLRLGLASLAIRNTGRRLNVGNILLAQQGRPPKGGKVAEPTLSDLRESGDIEQNSDQVAFIHRPEMYGDDDPEVKGKAFFIIAKQRNGPLAKIPVLFQGEYFSFSDLK